MQMSKTVSPEHLAGDLMRFMGHVMKGDQRELFSLIAELELTMAQMRGLFVIESSEHALALTELAPEMGLSVAAAGRAVDGLVRLGFVSRTEDAHDRRVKRLALTGEGRAALARIAEARLVGLRRFAERLGERERAALHDALATVFAQPDLNMTAEGAAR